MTNPDVVVKEVEVVSERWGVVRLTTFDQRRRDGSWQTRTRETYDRGDGSAILLYDPQRRTVLLSRQFRYPAYANGDPDGLLIEVAAGVVEPGEDPAETILREAAEELGVEISEPRHVLTMFPSPGAATERLHLYAATYSPATRTGPGGGLVSEGEDIEVLELGLEAALADIEAGRIVDAKTIVLLQWAALRVATGDGF